MNAFLLSPEAAQDLIDIWEFIAGDNIDSADQVCEELQEAIQRIVEMPKEWHLRADLTDKPVSLLAGSLLPHHLPSGYNPAPNRPCAAWSKRY